MRKNKKQRKIFLYLLVVLGITVGFALLSTTLFINGTASIKSNTWNIHWDDTSISVKQGSVAATTAPNVSTTASAKDTVSFDVELELPGDFYEFEIDAINEGSVDGALDLEENWIVYKSNGSTTTLPSYLDFKVTYDDNTTPTSGDVLTHGTSKTYKIRVEFKSGIEELPPSPPPVTIEVEIPYVQHKEKGIKYDLGDLVYFDPISDSPCNSSTFDLSKINDTTSTCYKWRVITPDDTESKTSIKLQMDHNIVGRNVAWTKTTSDPENVTDNHSIHCESKSIAGPGGALSDLAQYTSGWTRVPLLNYSYDTSAGTCNTSPESFNIYCNYGVLTCTNGTCKISKGNEEKVLATGLRSRLITVEEVTEITNTEAANDALSQNFTIANNYYDGYYFFSNTYYKNGTHESGTGNTNLGWLVENTYASSASGSTTNVYRSEMHDSVITGIDAYWTLSSASGGDNYAWNVHYDGKLNNGGGFIDHRNHAIGIRPVINIEKNKITKE